MGDVVQLSVLSPGNVAAQQLNGELQPENGEMVRVTAVTWTVTEPSRRVILINLELADFERLTAGTSLRIKAGEWSRTFALSGMPSLRQVMKNCIDDLQTVWSPPAGGIGSRATANLASYIKDDDYPADAISNSWSGTTRFALLIDEKGKVADCMITATSGQAILDAQACALIRQRARFVPARDAQGQPSKDRLTSSIRWKMDD
jgi:TonB family protein